ncbi:MAG: fatty acid desaturase [Pseudomonadota bacterium]
MKTSKDGWLRCEIDRDELRALMARSDAKGLAHLAYFLGSLAAVGFAAFLARDTLWAIPLFWLYGSIYGFCNSLIHETHHATAFRTRQLNEVVHFLAGLMTLRNPAYDRRMHTRHHGKTGRSGSDPELAHPNPIVAWKLIADLFWLRSAVTQPVLLVRQLFGRFTDDELRVLPVSERATVRWQAAAILGFYAALLAVSLAYQTWLPLLYTYLAHIYGGFVPRLYALTQHVGMPESSNDFRVNSRTCYYNPIARAWYWNMNYHIEHHMFPLVPFHALPTLHDKLRDQMPPASRSVFAAWREIVACVRRQNDEPGFAVRKSLPDTEMATGKT